MQISVEPLREFIFCSFLQLYEHVKDMRQSAEAVGIVLMQIKDNDVAFNERLLSLESKYQKDINDLSDRLANFYVCIICS